MARRVTRRCSKCRRTGHNKATCSSKKKKARRGGKRKSRR